VGGRLTSVSALYDVAVAHCLFPPSPSTLTLTIVRHAMRSGPSRSCCRHPAAASSAVHGAHAWILDRCVFATVSVLSSGRFQLNPPCLQRHCPRTGEGQDPGLRRHRPPHPQYISPCPRHVRDSDPSPGPPGTARAPLTLRILVYDALEPFEFSYG
jgi:hypothetical protein